MYVYCIYEKNKMFGLDLENFTSVHNLKLLPKSRHKGNLFHLLALLVYFFRISIFFPSFYFCVLEVLWSFSICTRPRKNILKNCCLSVCLFMFILFLRLFGSEIFVIAGNVCICGMILKKLIYLLLTLRKEFHFISFFFFWFKQCEMKRNWKSGWNVTW